MWNLRKKSDEHRGREKIKRKGMRQWGANHKRLLIIRELTEGCWRRGVWCWAKYSIV